MVNSHPFRRAVTLVELVIVLSIMAVVGAMAAPRYGAAISRQRADGAAQRIVSDIAYARALARSTSATVTVTFTPTTYSIPSASDPLRKTPAPYTIDLSASPYRCTVLGGAAASAIVPTTGTLSTYSLSFNGYGDPTSIGFVVIRSGLWNRQITLDQTGVATITKPSDTAVKTLIPTVVFP